MNDMQNRVCVILTNLLLDRLKASAPARIVTVANLIPGDAEMQQRSSNTREGPAWTM